MGVATGNLVYGASPAGSAVMDIAKSERRRDGVPGSSQGDRRSKYLQVKPRGERRVIRQLCCSYDLVGLDSSTLTYPCPNLYLHPMQW